MLIVTMLRVVLPTRARGNPERAVDAALIGRRCCVARSRVRPQPPEQRPGVRALLLVIAALAPAADAVATTNGFDAVHYSARLEPDLATRTVRGRMTLDLRMTTGGQDTIVLDRGDLVVEAVREAGQALRFSEAGQKLSLTLSRPARVGERHKIEIDYHGAPRYGLQFHPQRSQLYTIFSTSQWLIVNDAPADRATLDLSVVLPAGLKAIGNGRQVSQRVLDDGRELYRWRQDTAVPSYTFGFAAGRFIEVDDRAGPVRLRYLADGYSAADLGRVFADSADMLRYFARRAGVRYPGAHYTQALVAETIGQELAGFALLSEGYGREVLADPQRGSLIAHEAAHQWWGNGVTCEDWRHFWLNEGFATFMAATYLQHRFGDAAYRRHVDGWRERVERLRAEGKDRPLVFPDWTTPSGDDRAVVYQKGAYALHLLRAQLGERVFWRGLRAYTRANFGRAVVTSDFQAAMERASGRSLAPFFQQWVLAPPRDGVTVAPLPSPLHKR